MSSFGSASSVAEEAESRDLSGASNSSISAPDNGRKQPSKGSSKNGAKGKESPWIKQANSTPMDARLVNDKSCTQDSTLRKKIFNNCSTTARWI